MATQMTSSEESQLFQTIEMFEVITQSQPQDYQSLEILKEAYSKLGREDDVISVSKRIAEAYVLQGQLSSAILEYEGILQRCPDDAEVLAALGDIESRANSLTAGVGGEAAESAAAEPKGAAGADRGGATVKGAADDGRQELYKVFVESRVIAPGDFDLCWVGAEAVEPGTIWEPLVQNLADKSILPIETSLRLISDRSRLAYLPLERYEVELDLIRTFPAPVCQRWCVLPFDRMSKSILVATTNPFNRQATSELEQTTRQRLQWYLASPVEIIKLLRKAFR